MTVATRRGAAVDVQQESARRRVLDGTDPAVRVETGADVRVVALVGDDPSYAQAAHAAALASGADLALVLRPDRLSFVERAALVRDARPDVVLVAGETADARALTDVLEALRFGRLSAPPPGFLLAGDARLHERTAPAQSAPGERVPDVRAADGRAAVASRIRELRRAGRDIVLRDEAVESAARVVAAASSASALVLDVHGSSTSLAAATAGGSVSAIHTRLGVGAAADRVVLRGGLERVRRWMPRAIDAPALLERVFNRARWPGAVPAAPLSLVLEMALARDVIARALDDAARAGIDLAPFRASSAVVCTGRLALFPRPAQAVLSVLDGLAPQGAMAIARERPDEVVALGALAGREATVAIESAIEPLALALAFEPRRTATVRVTDDNGTVDEAVGRGALLLMPTAGAVDVSAGGLTARGAPQALGVVVDTRPRPLELPPRDAERIPVLARWHRALGAIDEAP